MGDAIGQHPGLAAAGAGDDHDRTIDIGSRFPLWFIQSVQKTHRGKNTQPLKAIHQKVITNGTNAYR